MPSLRPVEPVKMFIAALTGFPSSVDEIRPKLEKTWGKIDSESALMPFFHTDGYTADMGEDLYRRFFFFRRLIEPTELVSVRLATLALEDKVNTSRRYKAERALQLDPGYISLGNVVLSCINDLSHRIPLGRGVFGEVLLRRRTSVYSALEWTGDDFRSHDVISIFERARRLLSDQLAKKELR